MTARSIPPVLPATALAQSYASIPAGSKRLILLDYDGTLTPHVGDPDDAVLSPQVLSILAALAADERNALWIISGRLGEFLERNVGPIRGIGFSSEHGGFTRYPGATEWVGCGMYETPLKETWERLRGVMEKHVKRLDGTAASQTTPTTSYAAIHPTDNALQEPSSSTKSPRSRSRTATPPRTLPPLSSRS